MRAALVMALSLSYGAWHTHVAYAKGGGDAGEGDDDDGGGDDDDGGKGDKGDKGDKGGDDDDDDQGDGSDQPPVTAGGLFTIKTYPVRENSRPLTMTKGLTQLRLAIGTDLSSKGAFQSFGVNLEGQYGYSDNFTLLGGLTDAYNFKQFGFYFGFEGSLVYDVLDIRLAANVHRNAVPFYDDFCDPPRVPGQTTSTDNATMDGFCHDANGQMNTTQSIDTLPNGNFDAGGTKFSIDLGFPFRYAFRPEVALVALQTLMSIDFNPVDIDHVLVQATGAMDGTAKFKTQRVGNSAKPDFNPSVGLATNPIPQLSVVVYAQLRVPDFDFAAGFFQIPVTGRIEASPNQQLDFGLEFTLLNIKPQDPQSPIDNRFLSLFMQARY
ncbi:MAG: hypothetical protein ABJE66_06000 [Deltaproteobacteria bacterium]